MTPLTCILSNSPVRTLVKRFTLEMSDFLCRNAYWPASFRVHLFTVVERFTLEMLYFPCCHSDLVWEKKKNIYEIPTVVFLKVILFYWRSITHIWKIRILRFSRNDQSVQNLRLEKILIRIQIPQLLKNSDIQIIHI